MKKRWHSAALLAALLFILQTAQAQCDRMHDSLQLVKFYHALHDSPWTIEWDTTMPIDTWYGVTLTSDGGVKGILLDGILDDNIYTIGMGNNLQGQLPADLDLPCLERLELSINSIHGPIPDFQGLPKLQWLLLRSNHISGNLPDFSAMPDLAVIDLIDNHLSGPLPSFQNCQKLASVDLSCNHELSGNIPAYNLPNLWDLQISGCGTGRIGNLSGPLHDFSGTPKLTRLRLNNNKFSGTVPDFNLPNLSELRISGNYLSGQILDFSKMPNLVGLFMIDNYFDGEVPPFTYCQQLQYLWLSGCFSRLHPDFPKATKLSQISIPGSCLQGNIPNFTNIAPSISDVDLGGNNFDEMPILTGSNWSKLNVAENRLTFEDILSNTGINGLLYGDQKKIWEDTTFYVAKCAPLFFDLDIDDAITTNNYVWMLNGVPIDTINSNKFLLPSITQAGIYRCEVTNPGAPLLTLKTGEIKIIVTSNSDCQCPIPTFGVAGSADTICKNEQVDIVLDSTQLGYRYQLLQDGMPVGSAVNGHAGSQTFISSELAAHATFSIAVTETANPGCVTNLLDTVQVTVSEADTLIEISPAIQGNDGIVSVCVSGTNPSFMIDLSPPAGVITQPGGDCDTKFDFTQLPLGNYQLTITDALGCRWEKFIPVSLLILRPDRPQIHPVVTPNDDGKNDRLIFYGIDPDDDSELVIFNRYGNVLFRQRPYGQDWDGTYNGQKLPEGSYPFALTLFGQERNIVKGYVTILNQ